MSTPQLIPPGGTAYIAFSTFDSNDPSASVTISTLANTDVHIHRDGDITQRSSANGVTLSVDFDTVTGNHFISINTADNTDAGYYRAGSVYHVRIEGGTVDAGNINAWVGAFRIGYEGAILNTTIATLASQTSFTLAAGSTSNDAYNGGLAVIHDVASKVEVAQALISDYVGASKTVTLAADPGIFTMAATDNIAIYPATSIAVWDRVLSGATHNVADSAGRRLRNIQEAGGYSGGAIYIDTVNGTAGTTDFENGVDSNPVDSIADANTLATSLGISRFRIAPGSTITLAASQQNQMFEGSSWTLALGSQNIDGSTFIGATVSGVASNSAGSQYFVDCSMGACTLPQDTHSIRCSITGTQTLGDVSANYYWDNCHSAVAGAGTPTLDIGGNASCNINWRHYSGGLAVANANSTTVLSYEADGQLVINATCTSLTVVIRGNCSLTDNGTTSSITDDARYATGQLDQALVDIGLDHLLAAAVAGADVTDDSVIAQIVASGATADWDTFNNQTESLQALKDGGVDVVSINGSTVAATELQKAYSGLDAQANIASATGTTLVFNSGGDMPATDDYYNGMTALVYGGTGAGQARAIVDYDGATRTATVAPAFGTTPDATSDVIIIPGGAADAVAINNNTTAATQLALSAEGIISGVAQTGTLSTTQATTDLSGYLTDELKGHVLEWTSGTAAGQKTQVTAYDGAGLLTFAAIQTAPANNDKFVLL